MIYTLSEVAGRPIYPFFFMVAIAAVVLWFAAWSDTELGWGGHMCFLVVASGILAVAFYTRETYEPPKNTRVVGELVDNYEALVREKTGKATYADVPYSYVIYKLPDGSQVSFKRESGRVYPKNVYLYGN